MKASPSYSLWLPLLLALGVVSSSLIAPDFHTHFVESETGPVENLQIGLILVAFLTAATLVRRAFSAGERMLAGWALLFCAGLVFLGGEEASWGQHWFQWATPDHIAALNDQNETNLHNMSSWLDQKPRALLEIAVILGGIIHPIYNRLTGRRFMEKPWWLWPTQAVFVSAVLAEIVPLPERLWDLGAVPAALRVYRESELQEMMFYAFILIYLIEILRRLPVHARQKASQPA